MWDETAYPFPNFNGGTVEVRKWISNFIPRFTDLWLLMLVTRVTCPTVSFTDEKSGNSYLHLFNCLNTDIFLIKHNHTYLIHLYFHHLQNFIIQPQEVKKTPNLDIPIDDFLILFNVLACMRTSLSRNILCRPRRVKERKLLPQIYSVMPSLFCALDVEAHWYQILNHIISGSHNLKISIWNFKYICIFSQKNFVMKTKIPMNFRWKIWQDDNCLHRTFSGDFNTEFHM